MSRPETSKNAVRKTLNRLFEDRGFSRGAIAAKVGVKKETLRTQIASGFPRQRLRLVLEAVVDSPVWSSSDEFFKRKALRVRLGFDPYTIPAEQLRRQIPGLKIRGWRGKWKRRQIIELLELNFLSSNDSTNPKP